MVRKGFFVLVAALWGGVSGCAAEASDAGVVSADEGAVCPPGEPDCDRIDEPCVRGDEGTVGPGAHPLGLGSALTGSGKHPVWPKGRVPYKIDGTVGGTTKSRLNAAMGEWETKTQGVVRFEKATASDEAYVIVTTGDPRVDQVGYKSKKVSHLYLRDSEYQTVIRHELGHVLGLEHEHRRKDRADSIKVVSANIVDSSNCKYQFELCSDCALLNKYNVKSVMHYRTYRDLSKCRVGGKGVLFTADGGVIDHEWVIGKADVNAIYELYGEPAGAGGAGGAGGKAGAGGSASMAGASGEGGQAGDAGAGGEEAAGGEAGAGGAGDGIDEGDEAGGAGGEAGAAGVGGKGGAGGAGGKAGAAGAAAGGKVGAQGGGGFAGEPTTGPRQVDVQLGAPPDESAGCGCSVPGRRGAGVWGVALAGAIALGRRRGRRGIL